MGVGWWCWRCVCVCVWRYISGSFILNYLLYAFWMALYIKYVAKEQEKFIFAAHDSPPSKTQKCSFTITQHDVMINVPRIRKFTVLKWIIFFFRSDFHCKRVELFNFFHFFSSGLQVWIAWKPNPIQNRGYYEDFTLKDHIAENRTTTTTKKENAVNDESEDENEGGKTAN